MLMSAPITSGGDITATSQGSIVDNNAGTDFISIGDATLTAQGGTVGTASNPIDVSVGGDLYITANGQDGNISAVLTGSMGNGQVYVTDDTPGVVIFNNRIVGGGESAAINNTVGQMSARAGPLFMDVTTQPILFDGFGLQTDPGLSALSQDTLSN